MRAQDVSLTNFSVSPLPSTHREFRLAAELFFENTKQSSLYWDVLYWTQKEVLCWRMLRIEIIVPWGRIPLTDQIIAPIVRMIGRKVSK